ANLSYCAIGSPSLLIAQGWLLPSAWKSWLPATGPLIRAPVDLSKTAKDSFTHWTYCVMPTAPFVSGGAASTTKPLSPLPRPAKFNPEVVARLLVTEFCTTVSGAPVVAVGSGRVGRSCSG